MSEHHTTGANTQRALDDHVHTTKTDIAVRLRHIRQHHPEGPFSLAKLAKLAGVSKRTLASAESAEGTNLTIETLVKLAHSLGIQSCAYFLDEQVFQQVNKELEALKELRRQNLQGVALRTSHPTPLHTTTDQLEQLLTGIIDAAAQARDSLHGTPLPDDEAQRRYGGP
ncbi:helix-turn-helix domain-containing protein [Streptomyces sp. NPDC005393]|uniref:helix-turn-helix domain-containing protein n=1 Tax=Streptomyces sp. NPDC005393 TaxID=3157041 RepID=UPI0033A0BC8B